MHSRICSRRGQEEWSCAGTSPAHPARLGVLPYIYINKLKLSKRQAPLQEKSFTATAATYTCASAKRTRSGHCRDYSCCARCQGHPQSGIPILTGSNTSALRPYMLLPRPTGLGLDSNTIQPQVSFPLNVVGNTMLGCLGDLAGYN